MRYWLMKSEPGEFSVDDLASKPKQTIPWFGVRNYQARNFMRDQMKVGDRAFFYHSNCDEPGIAGIVEVSAPAHPDETQFDRKSRYYDAAATTGEPRWFNVDLKFVKQTPLVGIGELRSHKALARMQLLQRGNRLSITPVTKAEWDYVNSRLIEA